MHLAFKILSQMPSEYISHMKTKNKSHFIWAVIHEDLICCSAQNMTIAEFYFKAFITYSLKNSLILSLHTDKTGPLFTLTETGFVQFPRQKEASIETLSLRLFLFTNS